MRFLSLVLAVPAVPAVLLCIAQQGCGGSKPDPVVPPPASGTAIPPTTYPSATASTPPTTPPTTPPAAGGQATPIDISLAKAAIPVLLQTAATEAPPGMGAEGSPFAANFAEGQTFEQALNILPNKCYTVIAVGIGITDLTIQLVGQAAPLPPIVFATNTVNGPNPVLGAKSTGCWKNPTPLSGPGKVILKAAHGAGVAAAQIYSR